MKRHALIAGVSGIVGRHLAEHMLNVDTDQWDVTGISRHARDRYLSGLNGATAGSMPSRARKSKC